MSNDRTVTITGRHADNKACCESSDPAHLCAECSRALHHSQIRAAMAMRTAEKVREAADIAKRASDSVLKPPVAPVPEVRAAVDIDYSKFTPPDPYSAGLKAMRAAQGIKLPGEVIETGGCPDGYASHLAAIRGE